MSPEALSPLEQADQYLRKTVRDKESVAIAFGFRDIPQFLVYHRTAYLRTLEMALDEDDALAHISACEDEAKRVGGTGIFDILILENRGHFISKALAAFALNEMYISHPEAYNKMLETLEKLLYL